MKTQPESRAPAVGTEQTEVGAEAAISSSTNPLSTLEPLEWKLRRLLPSKPALTFKKAETQREKTRRENFFGVPIFQTDGGEGERGGERDGDRGGGGIERDEKGRGDWGGSGGRERRDAVQKNTSSSYSTTLNASAAVSSTSSSPLKKIKGRFSATVEKWKTRKKHDATVKVGRFVIHSKSVGGGEWREVSLEEKTVKKGLGGWGRWGIWGRWVDGGNEDSEFRGEIEFS